MTRLMTCCGAFLGAAMVSLCAVLALPVSAREIEVNWPVVSGVVNGIDGLPAANADVSLIYVHSTCGFGSAEVAAARTNARGEFSFEAGHVSAPDVLLGLQIDAPHFSVVARTRADEVAVSPVPGAEPLRLKAVRWPTLTVQVLTPDGQPMAGVHVAHLSPHGALRTILSGTTGPGGVASILVPAVGASLVVWGPAQPLQRFSAERETSRCVLSLPGIRHVEGHVKSRDGVSLPGVLVSAEGSDGVFAWTYAGEDGSFLLDVPDKGVKRLVVQPLRDRPVCSGVARDLGAEAVARAIDVVLPDAVPLSGTLRSLDGVGIAGAVITVLQSGEGGEPFWQSVRTDSTGRYSVGVPKGQVTSIGVTLAPVNHAFGPDGAPPAPKVLRLRSPAVLDMTADLRQSADVTLRVVNSAGAPAERPVVRPLSPNIAVRRGEGGDVVTLCRCPQGGRVAVYARSSDSSEAAMETLSIADDGMGQLTLQLKPSAAATVALTEKGGDAVPALVYAYGDQDAGVSSGPVAWDWCAPPGEPGRPATLRGLIPGQTYRICWQTADGARSKPLAMADFRRTGGSAQVADWRYELPRTQQKRPNVHVPIMGAEEQYESTVARLEAGKTRRVEDGNDPGVTWYVLPGGVGMVDTKRRDARLFADFFGLKRITVTGFAFDGQGVWMGTDAGLFRYERERRYWARIAVGGQLIDPSVERISLEGAKLACVIRLNTVQRTFTYDPQTERWRERH